MKTALITGASSGIGREIAYLLAKKGYSLVLAARRKEQLTEVADFVHKKYKVQVVIKVCDLSDETECRRLFEEARPYNIDILVNCAGVCVAEDFAGADLDAELSMIDTNIKALHILMKLFLTDMSGRVGTYILNVADAAALRNCGPHTAAYQATKAYVLGISLGVAKELEEAGSPTVVTAVCPGPVDTEFDEANGIERDVNKMSARSCAKAAVKGMFKGKNIVAPVKPFFNDIKLNVLFRKFKFFAAGIFMLAMLAGAPCISYATEAEPADDAFSADGPVDGDEAQPQEGDILPISDMTSLPVPSYVIPDDADLTYEEVEYKIVDHYDPGREPMNGEKISVSYKGLTCPAYYWKPGDMVVLQVSLADEDIPDFWELSQEDQDTWKAFLDDDYATPEEAYYAQMLPTYTFWFDFDKNKIIPFVEFDYGTSGKVVMMDYTEDQKYYLEELSPSFLKLPPFEFETYQFLSVNDDSCYHILSCMDQVGNVYLYQYDANGNACARVDVNTLIGLRYLAERTIALNEYIDKVNEYKANIRKIIAGAIIFVVVILFAFIFVIFGRHKTEVKHADEPEIEDLDDKKESKKESRKNKQAEPIKQANPSPGDDIMDLSHSDESPAKEEPAQKIVTEPVQKSVAEPAQVKLNEDLIKMNQEDELEAYRAKYMANIMGAQNMEAAAPQPKASLPQRETYSAKDLDELTRKYTASDTANFKKEVLDDLRGKSKKTPPPAAVPADEEPLPVIELPEDLLAQEKKTAPLPAISFEPEALNEDEGDDFPIPDDIDKSEILPEPTLPAQSHGPAISSEDLDKLTMKYTSSETELFKRDILEGLSETGFKPESHQGDPTEGGLFYPGDTELMRDMFRPEKKKAEKPPKRMPPDDLGDVGKEDEDDGRRESGWSVEMPKLGGKSSGQTGLDDFDVMDLNDI